MANNLAAHLAAMYTRDTRLDVAALMERRRRHGDIWLQFSHALWRSGGVAYCFGDTGSIYSLLVFVH
jgi:hypothetical protein